MRAKPTGNQLTTHMTAPNLKWIANYVWGIADDVLRDVYVRGKYRDVILPMTVLRPLDAALDLTKEAVLDIKATLHPTDCELGPRAPETDRAGYLEGHVPRPPSADPAAANLGRCRELSRRIPTQRAGHPRQLWVPLPFPTKGSPMSPQGGFRPPFHI